MKTIHYDLDTINDIGTRIKECIDSKKIRCVFFFGNIGFGKTALIKAILKSYDIGDVHSPTYNILNIYSNENHDFYHYDLYRLKTLNELEDLGIEEMLTSNNILMVEWPELLKPWIKTRVLECHIHFNSEKERTLNLIYDSF